MDQSASEPTQRCTGPCGQDKPLDDFPPDASYAVGRRSKCRECKNKAAQDRHAADPEKNRAAARERWAADPEKYRTAARQRYRARPEGDKPRRAATRARVFAHYGVRCACCGSTADLTIDHIDTDGAAHRRDMFGHRGGLKFYLWLIREGFPDGYQTLCRPCNSSKANGKQCRLNHPA